MLSRARSGRRLWQGCLSAGLWWGLVSAAAAEDATSEIFQPGTDTGGHDGEDGRGLRYLEWTHAPAAGAATYTVDYAIVVREPDGSTRSVHDRHELGLFPEATWLRLIRGAGLEPLPLPVANPYAGEQAALVARRPT